MGPGHLEAGSREALGAHTPPPALKQLTSQGDAWKALANGSGRQEGLGAGHGRREASPPAVTPGPGQPGVEAREQELARPPPCRAWTLI